MEILKTLLTLAVLAFGALVGLLLIVGGADGQGSEQGIVRLRGSKAEVMERLNDPKIRRRWVVGCGGATSPSTRFPAVGSTWSETIRREGVKEVRSYEIMEYVPNEKLVLRTSWGGTELLLSYELHAHRTGSQTQITYGLEAHFEGWKGKLFEPLLLGPLFAQMERDMENLARLHADA